MVRFKRKLRYNLRSPEEIELMRYSGAINAFVLKKLEEALTPGVRASTLDQYAEALIRELGGKPAFKGYAPDGHTPYPYTITLSIDEEIVHGLPTKDKIIREGQLVSIDCGTVYKGWYSDSAISVLVGKGSSLKRKLIRVTRQALKLAMRIIRDGVRFSEYATKIQEFVESNGFSVVRGLTGHGVGRNLHEPPEIPNYLILGYDFQFLKGMTVAVEPMVAAGKGSIKFKDDGWTIVTVDGKPAAHFEHTLLVSDEGSEPLTVVTEDLEERFSEKVRKVVEHYGKILQKEKEEEGNQ